MVRGAAKRAVIVRPADSRMFEQAIFIVAESMDGGGMTQGQMLQEAQRIAGDYEQKRRLPKMKSPLAFAAGMGAAGCLWLASSFLL